MKILFDKKSLRLPCERINKAKGIELGRDLINFANKWNETHKQTQAIGLAACQVGIFKRVCIVKINGRFLIFVNPVVVGQSESKVEWKESCISLPGIEVHTTRHIWTAITADNLKGVVNYGVHPDNLNTKRPAYDMLLENVALQHECDHLNGVLILDRETKN